VRRRLRLAKVGIGVSAVVLVMWREGPLDAWLRPPSTMSGAQPESVVVGDFNRER